MPKVSVVIPCYNQGKFLQETLESVLNQTCRDFEIILVNDGSTDRETNRFINNLDNPLIKIVNTPNQGLPRARNNGIDHANGKYILPLDADDLIHKDYLKLASSILDNEPSLKVVYGLAEFIGDKTGPWVLPEFTMEGMLCRNLIYCTAMFRKSDFMLTGGYDPGMIHGWEDWDLWLRLISEESEIYRIPDTMFYYRIKKQSMISEIEEDDSKRIFLEQQMVSNHSDLYRKHFPEPITMLRELKTLREEKEQYERYKNELKNSFPYRLGNFILSPLKVLRRFIRK